LPTQQATEIKHNCPTRPTRPTVFARTQAKPVMSTKQASEESKAAEKEDASQEEEKKETNVDPVVAARLAAEAEAKRQKKLPPLEQTWVCLACKKVNPVYQKIVGSKMLLDVEGCSLCQTERPSVVKLDDDDDDRGMTASEKAALQAEELKKKMKAGLLARWNKKKREREEKLNAELSAMKPYPHARNCLKVFVPGPKPKIIPPLAIDETLEPGTLVAFVCKHGLNGAATRRVPVGETCPYCRKLAERRLWSWLENQYVYTRAFDEMEYGETQTVRYWGDELVGAKKPKGPQEEEEEEEEEKKDMFGDSYGEKEEKKEKKTVEKISNAHVANKDGLIVETFPLRNWEHTLARLNNKDKFNEVSLLCLAFEPETFWNTIRFYNVAEALEEQDRLDRERGIGSPASENTHSSPKLLLHLKCANGLRKADYFGLSDPYGVIYFNDKEVGRTEVIPDDLNPVWNCKLELDTTGIDWTSVRLRIDIWDSDFMLQNPLTDDFLGRINLSGDLLQVFLKEHTKAMTMKLERKRGVTNLLEMKDVGVIVTGTLTLHGSLKAPPLTPQERRRLKKRPERGDGDWAVACRSWREVALKKWDSCFGTFRKQRIKFDEALRVPKLLEPVLMGVFATQEEIDEFQTLVNIPECNAEIDDRNQIFGYTALHLAAAKNLSEICEMLITGGAQIDSYDFAGSTPLHLACAEGFTDVCLLLQKLGADVFCKDRAKNDCFDILQAAGHRETAVALSKTLNVQNEMLWRARRFYKDLMHGRADMYDQRHKGRRFDQGKTFACTFAMRKKKIYKVFKDPKYLRKEYCVADLYDPTRFYELGLALWKHKPTTTPTFEQTVKNWNPCGNRDEKKKKRLKELKPMYVFVLGYDPKNPLRGMPGGIEEFMTRLDHADENLFQVWRKKKGMPAIDVEYEMAFGKKKGQSRAESALADLMAGRLGKKKSKDGKKKKKKKKKKKSDKEGDSGAETE